MWPAAWHQWFEPALQDQEPSWRCGSGAFETLLQRVALQPVGVVQVVGQSGKSCWVQHPGRHQEPPCSSGWTFCGAKCLPSFFTASTTAQGPVEEAVLQKLLLQFVLQL
eukprot:6459784-Amphidinium_carterae.1